MGLIRIFYLFSECFSIAGIDGLIACAKYLCGALVLSEIDEKSSVFSVLQQQERRSPALSSFVRFHPEGATLALEPSP